MFYYEITEYDRQQIMQALEWAEWALGVSMQTAKDEGAEPHVIDNLATEKEDCGRLWDHLNMMLPSRSHATADDVKAECDALFRKGQ